MMRIGHGYDVHRFEKGRKCIIGGVTIPFDKGLAGHSDADVLLHAIADALLGAAALGDIGKHFPDNDPAYAGADSLSLLEAVILMLETEGYQVGNIDSTVMPNSLNWHSMSLKCGKKLPAYVELTLAISV